MEFSATKSMIKNIQKEQVLNFLDEVVYQDGQIVSKTLSQNKNTNLTLFAFDKNEEISTHTSKGDALIMVLDGIAKITIGENTFEVKGGESIVMPSQIPHAVFAKEKMKMLLIVIF